MHISYALRSASLDSCDVTMCADSDHWLRFFVEHVLDAALKLPLIYMMDCTRNDCGFIIRPILQV